MLLEQPILAGFQLETCVSESCQNGTQPTEVFVDGGTEDDHVIKVNQTHLKGQPRHHYVQQPLERGHRVAEHKRHGLELELSFAADERRLVRICFIHRYLVVGTPEAERREPTSAGHRVQAHVSPRQRIRVFPS